jgi:sugar lactone lactonase YvrE
MTTRFYLIILSVLFSTQITNAQFYVTTYSGNGTAGLINGYRDSATFTSPFGLCRDMQGNIFIADGNNCIRKIDVAGIVSTYAGTSTAGFKDGSADSAQFNSPSDLCVDDSGNIYVSDFLNQRIRKIDINRNVSTIAGNGQAGYVNGTTNARFNYPRGICRDRYGNIYVADSWNHRIRKIDATGNVSTYAGGGNAMGVSSVGSLQDGPDTAARFYTPSGLTIDNDDNLFVADAYNHRIRRIDTSQYVSTIAGSGATGQGNGGYANGNTGSAVFNTPTEVYYERTTGKLYISDTFNNRIRLIDFGNNSVATIAGNGTAGYINDIDTSAEFNFPRALTVDSTGIIYLCDYNNHSVRMISNINVSVSDLALSNNYIFPNPSNEIICIHSDTYPVLVNIYNMNGQLVLSDNAESSFHYSDVSKLKAGLYFVKLISDKHSTNSRFIRN